MAVKIFARSAVALVLAVAASVAGVTQVSAQSVPRGHETDVGQLHAEVRSGTLLHTHGSRMVCGHCMAEVATEMGTTDTLNTTAPAGYGPADLQAGYDLPAGSTSNATIAIIGAGVDATLAGDLATYRSTFGLSACTVASGCLRLENYTGGPQPAPQAGAGAEVEEATAVETSLDVDMASASCGSCRIEYVSVPWQDGAIDNDVTTSDFATAVDTAVAGGAAVVSISYGYSADATNTSGATLSAFTHPGVPITASAGDSGFNGGFHQSWPSDLPGVIATGGTTLTFPYHETAWSGSGSGCETQFPAAHGQPASVAADCAGHLAASDISSDADLATGLAVYDTDAPSSDEPLGWIVEGGTSASAPFIAGLFARVGQLSGVNGPNTLFADPAKDFNDITTGNNEGSDVCANYAGVSPVVCNAGPGWDGPTGLGTPHGLAAF